MNITSKEFITRLQFESNWSDEEIIDTVPISNNIVLNSDNLNISFTEFKGVFSVTNLDAPKLKITFFNVTFWKNFNIVNSTFSSIEFSMCTFLGGVNFRTFTAQRLDFDSNVFDKGMSFIKIVTDTLNINLNKIKAGLSITELTVTEKFSLAPDEDSTSISINNYTGNKINKLQLFQSVNNNGGILLSNLIVHHFALLGYNYKGTIVLKDISLDKLTIEGFDNQSAVTFNRVTPNNGSILKIESSNLGKAGIYNIDFNKFQSIEIIDSSISGIQPNNIRWCKKVFTQTNNIEDLLNEKEVYRQLKIISIDNHDKFEELRFAGLEMDSYYKQIKKQNGSRLDKFILWTNKVSNKHGQDFGLAFLLLMATSIIFYSLTKFSLGEKQFDFDCIPTDIGGFFQFISPIHTFDKVFDVSNNNNYGWALMWDGISRIFISYLIYQFVSAFRKFVKK